MFQIPVKLLHTWFRCAHVCQGPVDVIQTGVDGVLGLMPTLLSLPDQLSQKGFTSKVLGICVIKYLNSWVEHPSEVGVLSFGGDIIRPQDKMTWIHMLKDEKFPKYDGFQIILFLIFTGFQFNMLICMHKNLPNVGL